MQLAVLRGKWRTTWARALIIFGSWLVVWAAVTDCFRWSAGSTAPGGYSCSQRLLLIELAVFGFAMNSIYGFGQMLEPGLLRIGSPRDWPSSYLTGYTVSALSWFAYQQVCNGPAPYPWAVARSSPLAPCCLHLAFEALSADAAQLSATSKAVSLWIYRRHLAETHVNACRLRILGVVPTLMKGPPAMRLSRFRIVRFPLLTTSQTAALEGRTCWEPRAGS